ncbi:MAG: hypothetical protein KC486_13445 [Myxococcales bacterium]|nr:hypothetical protein [Myxococcales bacterium]
MLRVSPSADTSTGRVGPSPRLTGRTITHSRSLAATSRSWRSVEDLRLEEEIEHQPPADREAGAGLGDAVGGLDDEAADALALHRLDDVAGALGAHAHRRRRAAAQADEERVLADPQDDDDGVLAGDRVLDGRRLEGVADDDVDALREVVAHGVGAADEGRDGVAAGGELSGDKASRRAVGTDDEDLEGRAVKGGVGFAHAVSLGPRRS